MYSGHRWGIADLADPHFIHPRDAESRQKVREVLAAEQAMKEMAVDEEPVVRRKSPAKKKKKAKRIPADAMQLD